MDEANLRLIVGSRMTKALTDLASHFRWHAFTDGQLIDTGFNADVSTDDGDGDRASGSDSPPTQPGIQCVRRSQLKAVRASGWL